jgi:hypothetical protein
MSKSAWKAVYRANRVAERRAVKHANRLEAWRNWAAGMLLLKSILTEEAPKLAAIAQADWKMDRITPTHWSE